MENLPLLVPLVILVPSIGAFINFFVGAKLGEKWSGYIGSFASIFSFMIALVLLSFVTGTNGGSAVVNFPFVDGWLRIDSIGLDIPWQMRVDSLSVTMMLVITGVGSLIHLYARGYMHGDKWFYRFFAYLNMFLAFMLILVTANNFLMLFVGWEGVGLCSFLLIGFWWDKKAPTGWKNSNAARKAFIVNRIGDFGLLMAMFLIFWTFGTLDFFKAGELPNTEAGYIVHWREHNGLVEGADHGETDDHAEESADHTEETDDHAEEGDDRGDQKQSVLDETEDGDDHAEEGDAVAGDDHAEDTDESADTEDDHAVEGEESAGGHGEEVVCVPADMDAEHAEETDSHADDGHGESDVNPLASDIRNIYCDNGHFDTDYLGVFGQTVNRFGHDEMVDFGSFEMKFDDVIFLIALFMLLGVTGKSAQIPLFIWLPDAMAGPTPVSALIHAATMVTAGVYMMVRGSVFLDELNHAGYVIGLIITLIGSATAIMAGFIAMGQWDIKSVLAYSTISQLGFMVAAVGVGAYVPAMFHLVTHAVFKALLFLGSGSVIHGVEHGHHHAHEHGHGHDDHHDDHHEAEFDPQDMRNMGGLRKKMPITFITYVIGTLALAGIFPFAGFWSKDEILADAFYVGTDGLFAGGGGGNQLAGILAFGILLAAAGFTAFYMWRQIELVFFGEPRTEAAKHTPESVGAMLFPLVVLAIFATIIGLINVPAPFIVLDSIYTPHNFGHFLEHSLISVSRGHTIAFNPLVALVALGLGLVAIYTAREIYGKGKGVAEGGRDQLELNPSTRMAFKLANAKLYWDETYFRFLENPFNKLSKFMADRVDWDFLHDYVHDSVIKRGFDSIAKLLSQPFDIGLIDGAVNGIGWLVQRTANWMRGIQTGNVRMYAVILFIGVVAVILVMLLPFIQTLIQSGS